MITPSMFGLVVVKDLTYENGIIIEQVLGMGNHQEKPIFEKP